MCLEEERSSRQNAFRDYDESESFEAEYDDERESEEDGGKSRDAGTDYKAKWGSSITKAKIKPIPNFQAGNVEDDEAEDLGLYGFNKSYEPESYERAHDSASEESKEETEDEDEEEAEQTADDGGSGSASSSSESVEEERDDSEKKIDHFSPLYLPYLSV